MAANKSGRGDSGPCLGWVLFHVLSTFLAILALLSGAECAASNSAPASPVAPEPRAPGAPAPATRVRRSDDYDNTDNFLMGSSDYDNFFLKSAKSVPRIGRRSGSEAEGEEDVEAPVHVDRRSADTNELVPSGGYDHFFLKASKSVPRIGKRNDEYFMKTAKSVPRIGRRGAGPLQALQHSGRVRRNKLPITERQLEQLLNGVPDLDKVLSSGSTYRDVTPFNRARRAHQVEEDGALGRDFPGGNDAILGRPHRLERRNYDGFMAAKSVPRMGKRPHPALVMQTEVGESSGQWPWFRQQDSPGPNKRSNPVDLLNLEDLPWESVDALIRSLKGGRIEDGTLAVDDNLPDIILLDEPENGNTRNAAWLYSADNVSSDRNKNSFGKTNNNNGSKELEEVRFQPDV